MLRGKQVEHKAVKKMINEWNGDRWSEDLAGAWTRFLEIYPQFENKHFRVFAKFLGNNVSDKAIHNRGMYVDLSDEKTRELLCTLSNSPHYHALFKMLELKNGKPE